MGMDEERFRIGVERFIEGKIDISPFRLAVPPEMTEEELNKYRDRIAFAKRSCWVSNNDSGGRILHIT